MCDIYKMLIFIREKERRRTWADLIESIQIIGVNKVTIRNEWYPCCFCHLDDLVEYFPFRWDLVSFILGSTMYSQGGDTRLDELLNEAEGLFFIFEYSDLARYRHRDILYQVFEDLPWSALDIMMRESHLDEYIRRL